MEIKGRMKILYILAVLMAVILELSSVKIWFHENFHYGHILLVGFLLSFILTPEIREFSKKINLLDHPGGRKRQKEAIPLLGGIAIFTAFNLTILQNLNFTLSMKGILFGATIIFLIGLFDDVLGLMAHTKLLGQVIAVLIMTNMGYWGGTEKQIIIIIWVVGITNAFNFLDGMDGLAAGLGAIGGLYFAVVSVVSGQNSVAIISISLAGACLGFLVFNFKPATIYMGDSGSTLIGYLLASIGIVGGWYQDERQILISLSVPCLILFVPLFDMLMTSILRFVEGKVSTIGELLSYAGRDHIHHRIEKMGFSVVQSVLIIYVISAISGFMALIIRLMDDTTLHVSVFFIICIIVLGILKMYKVEKNHNAF